MRLREFLFGTTLMSIALITARASAPPALGENCRPDFAYDAGRVVETKTSVPTPSAPSPSISAPSPLISEDKVLGSAYHDIVSILSSENRCSEFFGGPTSVDVFNELVSKIRKHTLAVGVAMRMSGLITHVHDAKTKRNYRIFEKVSLNSNGPFYRRKVSPWQPNVPRVGAFAPDTQEARVLILLHELGHVLKGSDGQWLLPDDGKDEGLSRANSYKVEDVCESEISSLSKVVTSKDLGKYRGPDQKSPAQ